MINTRYNEFLSNSSSNSHLDIEMLPKYVDMHLQLAIQCVQICVAFRVTLTNISSLTTQVVWYS